MRTMPTNYTIQDVLAALDRGEITVNREYQRSDEIWPDAARSYLIETILLDFPIPKIALHQVTDPLTGKSYKELVDGQQRTSTVRAFAGDKFKLSSVVENKGLRGLNFSGLSPEQRTTFLNYQLNADLFLGAEPSQIREVFRRINAYTVPLNPEEQRHAQYQGVLKWFLHRLCLGLNDAWEVLGTFTPKALVRMADTKLLAEVLHAFLHGITTTNKKSLDNLYKQNDEAFAMEEEFEQRLVAAIDLLQGWEPLRGTQIMKPFQLYALLLAVMHVAQPIETLQGVYESGGMPIDEDTAVMRLSSLAEALEADPLPDQYAQFVTASEKQTNVKAQREIRFQTYCEALAG